MSAASTTARPPGPDRTNELIARVNLGEEAAFHELLERDQEWVRRRVKERLGPGLRGRAETVDLVQSTMVEVLRYRPNLRVEGREQFRALMARIVENVIRAFHDHLRAQCRDIEREQRLASASQGIPPSPQGGPLESLIDLEADAQTRAAFARLRESDRRVLELRYFRELSYVQIGAALETSPDAARMQCNRAEARLRELM